MPYDAMARRLRASMVLGPFAETKEPVLSEAERVEGSTVEGPVLSEVEGTSS